MNDLEICKKRLKENDLSLVFVKDGKVVIEGKFEGMKDLVLTVDRFGNELENSSVADSTVGKAAASIFILLKVNSVFAGKISKIAGEFLKENDIYFEYDELMENILNKDCTGICPFEKISFKYSSPKEVYENLKSFLKL